MIFVVWSLVAYRANSQAGAAMVSDSMVTVTVAADQLRFVQRLKPDTARARLVFFPGALVDPRAYAPLARAVAEAGYPATIVRLPRRGAFGGADSPELRARIAQALSAAPSSALVIAGHSRGAVVASQVAATRSGDIDGLVIIGSSHPRDDDLSSLRIPVTKVVGTRDGLASPPEVRQYAALLPPHTQWIWVEGGNHSQFGWYGFQPLDRRARIDAATQRRIMTRAVLDVLEAAVAREH